MEFKLENLNGYMYQKLDEFIEKGIFLNKRVILFGLNSTSYCMKRYLENKGISIFAYIDNDSKKREEANDIIDFQLKRHISEKLFYELISKQFIRAYKPEELLTDYQENVLILIASKYYVEMSHQLQNLGYIEHQDYLQVVNFFDLENIMESSSVEGLTEISPKEMRDVQLNILRYLKKVCTENNLRYFLCGGTLLGAVRHKGYIPWDDDIDVFMPLSDYKKLIDLLKDDERYTTLSIFQQKDDFYNFFMRMIDKKTVMKSWEYPFLMTSAVNIDVFPIHGLPKKREDIDFFYNRIRKLNLQFISRFIEDTGDNDEIIKERHFILNEVIQMMEQYDFDESETIGFLLTKYREREIMPRIIYQDLIEIEFEHEKFLAPSGYHEYLTRLYGDYMELPPEHARYTTHNYKAYWL